MEEKSVLIMLAAYNGEKYIAEQLESIINQDYSNWKLIIQDDGSRDNTERVIKEYMKKDDRIIYRKNTSDVHGAFENFFALAAYCKTLPPFDYYMFCDQDDIWNSDKIRRFVCFAEDKQVDRPMICYADMMTVGKEGKIISGSLNDQWGLGNKSRAALFFSHKVFGCNTIMNRALFDKVPVVDLHMPNIRILSHDNHYTKYAAVFGYVYYYPAVLMKYRRHGENSTAGQKYSVDLKRLIYRVTHISDLSEMHANIYNQSLITIELIRKEKLTVKQRNFIDSIEASLRCGGRGALHYCGDKKIIWGKWIENFSRKLMIVLGIYKKYLVR